MKVRSAEYKDIPEIVEMSSRFYVETSYAGFAPMDEQTVESLARWLIDDGVMLVADSGNGLVGMAALVVTGFMFNKNVKTAHEVAWWVDPKSQGAGVGKALLNAVEPACKARGVIAIQMLRLSESPPQAGALYERAGYRHSETCYTKGVT